MVERKKKRKRKDDGTGSDGSSVSEKPSKEEYAVAKWIRNNVPSKKTKFDRNHIVEYFTGSRAVDALLERSPWNKTIFETRQNVVDFLEIMLRHKFFHRAKKIVISEDELCKIRGIKKKPFKDEKKPVQKDKEEGKDEKENVQDKEKKDEEPKEQKKKPKVRLEMHLEQYFVDCNDAYVWIYEPVSVYYWFFGTLLVLGAIGVCLFPLWPLTVRLGVWYLSIAAAGFLVFMLALIIVRILVFCVIWLLTLGRHHFLILPNLIEDVGFFASFWPLYHYEYHGPDSDGNKKSLKKKKRKKDKDSDSEDTPLLQSEDKSENDEQEGKTCSRKNSNPEEMDEEDEEDKSIEDSANNGKENSEESSDSDKSHTGEDFEMI